MLFWLALLFAYQHLSNAAPTPAGPVADPILSHISSPSPGNILGSPNCPNLRSTWDIVWSCFATIFLCAWVSVHPNIPPPGAKAWQVAMTRLELMIWTILTPEMVIFWAMRQWYGARKLAELYKGVLGSLLVSNDRVTDRSSRRSSELVEDPRVLSSNGWLHAFRL